MVFGLFTADHRVRLARASVVFALLVFGVATSANAIDTTGLVAHYAFDGNANDDSGNANNGAVVGGASFVAGKTGSALAITSGTQYVVGPNVSVGTNFSFAGWYKIDGAQTDQGLIGHWYAFFNTTQYCGTTLLGMMYNRPLNYIRIYPSNNNCSGVHDIPIALPLDTWFHFATTYDGAAVRTYVNGVLIDQFAYSVNITGTQPLIIGATVPNVAYNWIGAIDDVYVFSRVLSTAEISSLAGVTASPVNGACGSANGVATLAMPAAGSLCSSGTASVLGLGVGSGWNWTCAGSGGGTTAPCSTPIPTIDLTTALNGSNPGVTKANDPIIVASGAHWIQLNLLNVQGRVPLNFELSYNSLNPTVDTGTGFGWTHRYGAKLTRIDATTAAIAWPNGRVTKYAKLASGWKPLIADPNDALIENPDGSWALTDTALTKHEFTALGALLKQTSRSGIVLNFAYTSGKLASVTEPISGRSLTFAWNAGNRLDTVTAPGGQTAQLAYSAAGDLTTLTNGADGTISHTYNAAHRIVTGTNELGQQFLANQFDAQGRVSGQDDGLPATPTSTLAYTSDASGYKTVLTDRNAKVTTYEFDTQFREVKVTDATGAVNTKAYDVNGNALTRTDANGKITTTTYGARNNPISTTDAAGRAVTMTYDASDNLLTLTDAAGSATTFT